MTFFQRFRTPFSEGPTDDQARYQPRMRMVGEHLQERREDLGLDLDEIGAMLRIKPAYLAALEQGRTHDLPGPTYAIGFVRAYADFLGLDSEAVLARFKAEAAGVTARPDLALPVPLGERSLPGGALVLVALITGLCGYGIWYYHSTEERNRPERVANVPAALQVRPAPSVAPPTSPPPVAADSNGQPPAQPSLYGAAASPSTTSAPPLPSGASPPSSPLPDASPASTPSLPAPQTVSGNLAPGALLTPIQRNPLPAASTASQPAMAPPPASPLLPLPPQQTAQQVPPTSPAASQPSSAALAAPPPAAAATGGQITIKAINDCWIQIRAADQSIVFSRVLKAGETYTVPQRSGLSLRTGNAGALEVAVDGKTVPSIGGIGALRRDVQLDPAELQAGTAVHG